MVEKTSKERKDKIMNEIAKANSEEYVTSWDEEGRPISKKKSEIDRGKKSRASGTRFEAKVREKLEIMGWVVDKWTNTVDYDKLKLVPAKRTYNPFKKVMVVGTGFPDFVAIRPIKEEKIFDEFGEIINSNHTKFEVVGVEVKSNGYLNPTEKGMCMWLIENKIFSRILIAKKGKKRGEVEYIDFREKHGSKFLQ